ncbi:MAG: hypothetical protein JW909_09265 [Planctomycetes bacterium]|nr:hypothetical protein [Planctomycetota bacterium]
MKRILDIAALSGMAAGIALLMQPWWPGGFRLGFFATLVFTVVHVFTSHMNKDGPRPSAGDPDMKTDG